MKTKAIQLYFLRDFWQFLPTIALEISVVKQLTQKSSLLEPPRKEERVLGGVIPVVSPPLLGGSQCSNPARVTTLTTGLSNSTVVPPVLSTAVAVQQMEMDSTFLCRRPLDAQLKLWSRLRYPSLKWFLDHPCAQHGSFFFLSSCLQMLPFKFPQQNGFCSLF